MAKRAMLIRIDDDLHKQLHEGAYKERTSMVEFIRQAITERLARLSGGG